MTKPRARLPGHADPVSSDAADPAVACLSVVRPPPRAFHAAPVDVATGRALCKFHMKGKPCFHGAACSYAHAPLRDRATCWQYERYGTCARSLERERLAADDPAAPPPPACWFPHPPCPAFDAHVAIQCDLGASARVVRRCRELVGPSAVVASARADLRRDGDCIVYVRGDNERAGGGAAGVARALAEDPHALAAVKRVFLVQDARTCVGGDLPEAFDDALGACVAAALEEARHAEVRKAVTSGSTPPARLRVRARCFPKRGFAARRVASSLEEAERTLSGADAVVEACPNANRATHVLDVVCAKNRAHVKVWSSTEVVLEEEEGKEEEGTEGEGNDATDATDASDASSSGRGKKTKKNAFGSAVGYPRLPRRGAATLRDLLEHCSTVMASRERRSVPCRAYHKLEEAALRAGIRIGADWRCVDVGASPGGWTKFISDALVRAAAEEEGVGEEGRGGGEKGGVVARGGGGGGGGKKGHVWAIDPGALTLAPLPENVTHLAMKAEDARGAIEADAATRGMIIPGTHCGEKTRLNVRLLVCDANVPPREVAEILRETAARLGLEDGAVLATTFKNFCGNFHEWEREMDDAMTTLREGGFVDQRLFHLFANCAQEKTLVATYRSERARTEA